MKKHFFWSVLMIIAILFGCSSGGKEEIPTPTPTPMPEKPTPEIKITTSIPEKGLECSFNNVTQNITFTTNTDWTLTIEEGKEWCTASLTQGKAGNISVTFTLAANDKTEERKAKITIKANTVSQSLTIIQNGKPQEEIKDDEENKDNEKDKDKEENEGTNIEETESGNPNGTVGNMKWE